LGGAWNFGSSGEEVELRALRASVPDPDGKYALQRDFVGPRVAGTGIGN
jgi:hypothetical protein